VNLAAPFDSGPIPNGSDALAVPIDLRSVVATNAAAPGIRTGCGKYRRIPCSMNSATSDWENST
jgi:hypothetical protein